MMPASSSFENLRHESVRQLALARCEQEIADYSNEPRKPAWLVTLGVEDWEMEKRLIAKEPLLVGRLVPRGAWNSTEAKTEC